MGTKPRFITLEGGEGAGKSTQGKRLAAALALLNDPALDALIAPALRFDELPARLASVFAPQSDIVCQLIRYPT